MIGDDTLRDGPAARHNHRKSWLRILPRPDTISVDSATETGRNVDDIFLPSGRLRPDLLDEPTTRVLREALAHTRATNWDSVRTPHLFMGLLAAPGFRRLQMGIAARGRLPGLLDQFRELFFSRMANRSRRCLLNREFLSDNVIRLLRDATIARPRRPRSRHANGPAHHPLHHPQQHRGRVLRAHRRHGRQAHRTGGSGRARRAGQ